MADPVDINDDTPLEGSPAADIEMEVVEELIEDVDADGADDALPNVMDDTPARRITFLDYLKSPIVELVVGTGDIRATLTAHQDLLTQSPFFEQACADFAADVIRRIELLDEDVEAMGSFLEYLYKGEYFPKRIGEGRDGPLEQDPSVPAIDDTGDQLLKHARIYTLADRFYMPTLKSLAHSKIHRTTSTARGEIAYARYVYSSTQREDPTLRKPVAAFWATRSHVLRHEAEQEFRSMCLEYPEFGFDVLTLVLDQKEKGRVGAGGVGGGIGGVEVGVAVDTPSSARGRKRARGVGV